MIRETSPGPDYTSRMINGLMLTIFAVAILIFLIAPLPALSWRHQPFAGFTVGASLIVNRTSAAEWPGMSMGIAFPQRVERVAGRQVLNADDLNRVLAAHQIGDQVSIFTRTREDEQRLYPDVRLIAFPAADMLRFFWIPYLIGAIYLIIGIWIFRLRGQSRPGRALAAFCIFTAGACGLLFDIYSTHRTDALWILAMANVGGALISLALRFPEEWLPVRSRTWLLAVPYLISIALGVWGMAALYEQSDPWAYIPTIGASYRYAAVSVLFFLAMMIYRARKGATAIIRRQARLVLAGSFIAFAPMTVWMVSPLFGIWITFNPMVFMTPLLLFPLSIAVAILRFRLWDIDNFVNRAFVYGVATAILAGVFSALIGLSQRMFVAFTGEKSDAAVVLSSLIIAAIFTPIRTLVQGFVDQQLKDEQDHMQELRSFRAEVEAFVQMSDVAQITKRLLTEAVESLGAESGALNLTVDERLHIVHTYGPWKNDAHMSVALRHAGQRYGLLQLGAHRMNRPYTQREGELLQQVADQVAIAIQFALPHYEPVLPIGSLTTNTVPSGAMSNGKGLSLQAHADDMI